MVLVNYYFDFGNSTIKKVWEGSIKFESPFDDIRLSEGKKIRFLPDNEERTIGTRDAMLIKVIDAISKA